MIVRWLPTASDLEQAYCTGFRQAASFSADLGTTAMLVAAKAYVREHGTALSSVYSDMSAAIEALPAVAPGAIDREIVLGILRTALGSGREAAWDGIVEAVEATQPTLAATPLTAEERVRAEQIAATAPDTEVGRLIVRLLDAALSASPIPEAEGTR